MRQPVLGTTDFSADRETSMKPDRNTGPDGTLHYVSVFNPDVLPWKRMSALNEVGEDFTLRVHRGATTELSVGGTPDPKSRDSFWGDVMVELRPGLEVALPSVAPDMRILAYDTNPKVRLVFSKDGADNYYVRSDESSVSGTVHLVFSADADAGYFAPRPPARKLAVRELTTRVPPDIAVSVPKSVMREAAITLKRLGLSPDLDVAIALGALVAWGRGFAPGEIRKPTGNVYRDLCDAKTGVCRHRSYAFMVTANALGIPTRIVQNEAHAFVEVWLPDTGWQRIDLGGAAMQLDVTGANGKQLHRPRGDDPFAKPPEYEHNYTQLQGNIRGLTAQQRSERTKPLGEATPSEAPEEEPPRRAPSPFAPDSTAPTQTANPQKQSPTLVVTRASGSAYRGDSLYVEGVVRLGKRALGNHLVTVHLALAGGSGADTVYLGSLRSSADGRFQGNLPVPPDLTLSRYEVFASSPEDDTYNAAVSD